VERAPAWRAEVVVDAALARALIETQFPALSPVAATPLAAGWDNTAFLVNDSFVFRFPRRAIAVPLIATEIALLPWLASRLPVSIPRPAFAGTPSAAYPWPFAGYPKLVGRTLANAGTSGTDRLELAAALGRFLAALHAIPATEARERGAGPDAYDRLDTNTRRQATTERLEMLASRGVSLDRALIEATLDETPETPWRDDVLVHGDLHAGQILVDEAEALTGVIDWGDVHLGDPAVDLAAAHAILPRAAHDAFRRSYGAIDDVRWRAARVRAVWHTVALLASAVDQDDEAMIREAMEGLERILKA
jgi:aminoglycoside phosphotransferase (APT) family kinase protein